MIARLRGLVVSKDPIIVECNGVGYGVLATVSDAGLLTLGQEATLFIYENIKDDAHDLYGFVSPETKQLFELLLTVKNVGPKSALAVLDIGPGDEVRVTIAGGDVKALQTAKGVGKRAAEQMVVELRDKVGAPIGEDAENLITRGGINQNDEAVLALVSLGYNEYDAQSALQNIDPDLPTEDRIKQALKRS